MMFSLRLTCSTQLEDSLDLLGKILRAVVQFRDSNFDPEICLWDEVLGGEEVAAGDFFELHGGRWFVRSQSIPGVLWLKAIGVDQKRMFLEVGRMDERALAEHIRENELKFVFRNGAFRSRNGRVLWYVSTPQQPEKDLDPRSLWTHWFTDERVTDLAIRCADYCYTYDYELFPDDEQIGGPSGPGDQSMRLTLGLSQRLLAEQRPLLSTNLSQMGRTDQRLELRAIMSAERSLLGMSDDQMADFAEAYAQKHGAQAVGRIFLFTLAGRIKRESGRTGMTWKVARQLARCVIQKVQV